MNWYLSGGGEDRYLYNSDTEWANYMRNSRVLSWKIEQMIIEYTSNMGKYNTRCVSGVTHMDFWPGEGINGYQYLGGSNADVGDFQYSGTISVSDDGNIYAYMDFCWNDIIDPNPQYTTDTLKSTIAEIITFGYAQPYDIHISWTQEFYISN